MSSALSKSDHDRVLAEVSHWFFDEYLQGFIAAGAEGADASFVTKYWGAPLWVSIDDDPVVLAATPDDIIAVMAPIQTHLKAEGYGTTLVPDRQVTPINARSAAIRVIWSRCRKNLTEIERVAVNFTVMKRDDGWRILAVQQVGEVTAATLDAIWTTDTGGNAGR